MQTAPNSIDIEALRDECRQFTRYLVGEAPDDYVLEQYVALHETTLGDTTPIPAADNALLRAARSSMLGLRCADAYARFFRPNALLRHKLILAFAILENSRGYFAHFTSGSSLGVPVALLRIVLSVAGFCFALLASLILIAPRILLATRRHTKAGR